DALRTWLALHDRMVPVRIALDSYLEARFPGRPSVPLVVVHEAVQRDLAAAPGEAPPWFGPIREFLSLAGPVPTALLGEAADDRLRALAALRAESVRTIVASSVEDGDLVVAPETLRALATR